MITSSMETWQQLAERGLQVSSMQNVRVKELVALQQKSQQRRRKGLFVVEGRRELMHCMEQMFQRLHPHWKWQNITMALLNASLW